MNIFFNEDCLLTMGKKELQNNVDIILTSPPYNNNLSDEEYIGWTIKIFKGFDKILKKDGCVLYNMTYSSENRYLIWLVISDIIRRTDFITADCIVWKKEHSTHNSRSKNKLSMLMEYVFVFVRKSELKTFNSNKNIISNSEKTGQNIYENIYNFIEAKNNDGSNKLNKSTFSTDFVVKLLNIYGKPGGLLYDPFMGIGTSAKGAIKFGMNYIGSELSKEQVDYSREHLHQVLITDPSTVKCVASVASDPFWG